ncbi:uncharacterized protein LOC110735317 [Chenopodium quinoa]|uniref:uncharacterized protein LOC110735317 n=1 Tax=Chenopodium quinoa TaxID=63459 RepID=UPI000B795C87|nr:uncharacterized protein LOC110735317 [Chenopodium quinoa]
MDIRTSIYRFRENLQHKHARLAVRRRLLFKRTTNHEDHIFKHRRYLLDKEPRSLRLLMMQLRRSTHQYHDVTRELVDQFPNEINMNESSLNDGLQLRRSAHQYHDVTREVEQFANEINMNESSPNKGIDNDARPAEQIVGRIEVTHRCRKDEFDRRWEFGPRTVVFPNCKALMWIEERVKSSNKTHPRFNHCCQSGQVILPLLPLTPSFLHSVFPCQQFRSNIRAFNSVLAFTSMGDRIDNTVNDGRGPYVYRISGSNYHRIGTLLPEPGTGPKFAQLYIYDTENETSNRLRYMGGAEASSLYPTILQGLQTMLDDINPYVAVFRNARSMLRDQGEHQDLRIKLICAREGRQYIQPTASEVAALMVGDGTNDIGNRDIILQKVDGGLKRIDETHPSYMPFQYPLLFPYGTDGWRAGIPKVSDTSTSRNTVTMRQFYAFRIHNREEECDTLIDAGQLLQQFNVDAYAAMEQYRLLFIRKNQGRLRSDLYSGLQDAITTGDVNAIDLGRKFILPSSFTRSPRYMAHLYQDAIAVVRVLGPPDLFITFTCNPNWPQIVNEISICGNRRNEDRPNIVAHFYVIEFQKRGLPHAHILITLAPEDKPKCPEDIDVIISAKIPDKDRDPLTYETVTKNMLHGPCGPCLIDGKCLKHFPKKFCAETTFDENGFVQYRRRQNRKPIIVNGREVDNRWVVPYNRDLCVKYNAHINVERVGARSVVKYLYKYVTKGQDRATFVIENNTDTRRSQEVRQASRVDEIQQYLDCRSACHAIRLLDDDNEWHATLSEASTWASGSQLRNMFCAILMFSENQGLQEIEHILNKLGKSLTDFPDMPQPSSEISHTALNRLIRDELDYATHDEANRFDTLVRGLNMDQYRVYAAILDAHSRDVGGLFFVYGSCGTGKTYLLNTLIAKFRSERKIVLSVASSGIATLLLPGGKTAHSTFKIPFDPLINIRFVTSKKTQPVLI